MPPKKPAQPNKKDDKEDLNDPVPKNECQFKILMEAKQEGGHYFKVKYEWISIQGPDQIDFQKIDTGYFRDWTLIKIEGEEPKPVEEIPAKGAPAKKPAAGGGGAKPDPKKGGALEEITDNRPRQISYSKDFGQEMGGGIKITEEVAKRFSDAAIKVDIIEVNRETQEETLRDSVNIDLSCLLFPKQGKLEFTWNFDKLKPIQLHYLNLTIQCDQPLLSEFLRKKLNPLQIHLVACKDIPYKTEHKFKPIYCVTKFVDEKSFRTLDYPQQPFCKFMHKHVFLVGQHDPILFKELLSTNLVRVELHDCDEYVSQEDEKDAKFSVGCAKFTLKDFLRPNCKDLKLRSDVFPVKREQQDNTNNLDLNTTARKGERGIEKSSPYLINATYAVITAELSYPIGSFNEELEIALLKQKIEQEQEALKPQGDPKQSSQLKGVAQAKADPKASIAQAKEQTIPSDLKPTSAIGSDRLNAIGSSASIRTMGQDEFNEQDAIFERAIIIIPYKSPDTVKQIENSFEQINMKGLGIDNVRYINTKEFTPEERKNRKIDVLSGFEIMDSEMRLYIIEGLGGEGRGMNQFYKDNERQRPNDKKFKLIYNPEVRFKNRLYLDFNVALKKIKLRDTITKIMGSPDVYLRSKVPEDIYDTLQKFAELRKLDRMTLVRDFNLFPQTERLLNLERKYGDSLLHEDLYGVPQKPKRRRAQDDTYSVGFNDDMQPSITAISYQQQPSGMQTHSVAFNNNNNQKTVTFAADTTQKRERTKVKGETVHKNDDFEYSLKARQQEQKDHKNKNIEKLQSMSQGRPAKERMSIPEGVEVYMYGNQKLNIWEFQKEQLRKQISNDQKNFYTYSKDFLSLAFPLINENEIKMKEKELNESKWKTKTGFDNLIKKQNFAEHPKKPPQCILDDLQMPYVEQLKEKMESMKGRQPFKPEEYGKSNFQLNFRVPQTFGDRETFKTVFISGDDMVKEQLALQQKEQEEWRKKVVVGNPHFTVNTRQPKKIAQTDKHRTMLEDPPKKIGLRLSQSKLKEVAERQIMVTKAIENLPPSMNTYSKYQDPLKILPKLKEKDVTMMPDGKDFNTNIRNDTLSYSPKSKKVYIQPLSQSERSGPKWYGGNSGEQ